jgi:hypothetical protein
MKNTYMKRIINELAVICHDVNITSQDDTLRVNRLWKRLELIIFRKL